MKKEKINTVSKNKTIAFLAAACLFLAGIEAVIPKPLPFLRLGIGNLPVLFAVRKLRTLDLLFLVLLKVIVQGLVTGTLFSYIFLFSFVSSFAAGFALILVNRIFSKRISFVGLNMASSFANNMAQIILANYFIFLENTVYIAPVILTSGLISGFVLGCLAEKFSQKSRWYEALGTI